MLGFSKPKVSAQSHKESHGNQPDCSGQRRMNTEGQIQKKVRWISNLEDDGERRRMSAEARTGGGVSAKLSSAIIRYRPLVC